MPANTDVAQQALPTAATQGQEQETATRTASPNHPYLLVKIWWLKVLRVKNTGSDKAVREMADHKVNKQKPGVLYISTKPKFQSIGKLYL